MTSQSKYLIIALCILLLYILPFIIFGQDTYVHHYDNLDNVATRYHVNDMNGYYINFDPDGKIENVMNGIPQFAYSTGFYFFALTLYHFFEPFTAYALNEIIIRFIAFLGMYLLLSNYLLKKKHPFAITFPSLCFAILPTYTIYGLSFLGMPLLLYAFMNLYYEKKITISLIIAFGFPFFSELPLSGVHILFTLSIGLVYFTIKNKKIPYYYFIGIGLLGFAYLITNYHILHLFLINEDFTLHREEFNPLRDSSTFIGSLGRSLLMILFSRFTAESMHTLILVFLLPFTFYIAYRYKQEKRLLLWLFISAMVISFYYGFAHWEQYIILEGKIKFFRMFNIKRFFWFLPLLWYLILALSIEIVFSAPYGKKIIVGFAILQLIFLFIANGEYNVHSRRAIRDFINVFLPQEEEIKREIWIHPYQALMPKYTYREFYSEDLFQEIDHYIGRDKSDYRIVSIGMFPQVLQYSGFYTLDSCQSIYDLEYKHRFRRIIERELAKDETWVKWFDQWGSRCYIFCDEFPDDYYASYNIDREDPDTLILNNLDLNIEAFKEMGGEYIFSVFNIRNYQENQLQRLDVFENESSPYRIYLYQTK